MERDKPKVIIVDDDRDTSELLAVALGRAGFEVSAVPNGLKLIATLEVDQPDALLLDVNLSWIDGFELCRAVRQNDHFRNIPVVFVSARSSPEDLERGREAGASDYFTKPVELSHLIARLRELLKAKKAQQP